MQRDIAIRLDGMLSGARGNLDCIAHYMRNNLNEEEYNRLIIHIGEAMTGTIEISTTLHKMFPDILPDDLKSQK